MSKLKTGIAVATAVAAMTSTASAAEVTLQAVTSLLANNPLTLSFFETFQKPLNAQCKDTLQIRYLGAHNVVPPRNAGKAVKRGQFDMLHGPVSYHIGMVPEGYGMLASNVPLATMKTNGGWDLLKKIFREKAGAELIAWGETNIGYNTYLVVEPKFKNGVPDLSGIKMRATGTYRPLFNALGASTINMKSSEIYTGLQRGVVQGFGWPQTGVPALGLHKLAKYRIEPAFYRTNTVVTMNAAKYDGLGKAQKACLSKVASVYEKSSNTYMDTWIKKDVATMADAGMKTVTLKPKAANKYLDTAHGAIWKELKKRSDYHDQLRAKLYKAPGS